MQSRQLLAMTLQTLALSDKRSRSGSRCPGSCAGRERGRGIGTCPHGAARAGPVPSPAWAPAGEQHSPAQFRCSWSRYRNRKYPTQDSYQSSGTSKTQEELTRKTLSSLRKTGIYWLKTLPELRYSLLWAQITGSLLENKQPEFTLRKAGPWLYGLLAPSSAARPH